MDSNPEGADVVEETVVRTERSLRRVLAATDDDEARYQARTALQELEVLREAVDGDGPTSAGGRQLGE